ncbi:MAG TPA: diadenylate cyclase CdaA [Anaerolineae bacterium]|nr:diadenylate cyclase CdaA [Anaerolineae bacterium]
MSDVLWVLSHIQVTDVIDILLVAVVFYLLFSLAQGTQAVQLLRGMVLVILVAFLASQILPFQGFSWLVSTALPALLIAIPVIFQPELRRALERLGRTGGLLLRVQQEEEMERIIDEVTRAVHRLAGERHGALIVFERETGLQEFIETGVEINAEVKAELLRTIFHPNTALHDKAVIIRGDKVVAASTMLPTSHNPQYSGLGTRHRAAIGLTEESDALVVVVSEETGIVSVAYNGRMVRRMDANRLRNVLLAFFQHRLGGRGWAAKV